MQGLPTLKAFGQSHAYGRMLADKARALSDSTFWVLAISVLTRAFTDLGTALGAALALTLGAWRVQHGDMSLTALLIVLMAGTEIFRPAARPAHRAAPGHERPGRGARHPDPAGDAGSRARAAGAADPDHQPCARASSSRTSRFAYPGGRRAAHRGLSFVVEPGERVGIVGPSGSGKSSIVRLLLRLYDPQSGSVRIDGQDLRALDPEALRRMVAVVSQDSMLFHGTIDDNLRLGRPDATEADVVAAAIAANAHDFIMALPDDYETVIGERGAQLSGGQRQRIAIARALLRDSPILVLDEALSSVDAENEAVIQQALDRLMTGRTTLILAHRLSSVIGADRILVLEDGSVVAKRPPCRADRRGWPVSRPDGPATGGTRRRADRRAAARLPACAWWKRRRATPAPWSDRLPTRRPRSAGPKPSAPCCGFVGPWKGQLGVIVLCGIGRVLAFIGVGVFGALIIGAVRAHAPTLALVAALLVTAPLAGLLHWMESWLAHAMAYQLLAEMRIDLFRKLDALAPAYLLRRRSGDLVALATQDVETVEYFFAHTVAPAIVAGLVPAGVLLALFFVCWPLAIVLAPFLVYAGASPVLGRRRIDTLGSEARGALGTLGAFATETIQGLAELAAFDATARRRKAFMAAVRRYQDTRIKLLEDLTWQTAGLEVATGLGGLAVAALGAPLVLHGWIPAWMLPLLVLVSISAFLPVSEIAQVGRQLADTIASTRRLHVVHAEPVVITDGPLEPAAPAGGSALRFDDVTFTYPGRFRPALSEVSFAVPAGLHRRPGRPVRRRQDHHRQFAAALLGSRRGRHPAGRRRSARTDAGRPARARRAGGAGHLPVQRHAGRQCAAGPPRRDAGRRSRRRWNAPRWPASWRICRRAWQPASASVACSYPVVSASAWRSPAPS